MRSAMVMYSRNKSALALHVDSCNVPLIDALCPHLDGRLWQVVRVAQRSGHVQTEGVAPLDHRVAQPNARAAAGLLPGRAEGESGVARQCVNGSVLPLTSFAAHVYRHAYRRMPAP